MTRRAEQIIGGGVLTVGLLLFFVLIPYGVDSPSNIDHITLAPHFWPQIISLIFALMGLLLVFKPVVDESTETSGQTPWIQRLPRLAVVLLALFGFYYAIEDLGMVFPGMLMIFGMMWFAGVRRWWLMLLIALLVPLMLYGFFVHVANIPIPLGLFEVLRG